MTVALRAAPLVFVAAVAQVSVIAGMRVVGAEPDLLLVVLVAVALLRGSVVGACAGFAAGLLVDVMMLSTLGVTSVLLTVVGYAAGRYGETTARGRAYAPSLTAFAATVAAALGGGALHYLLGDTVAATEVLRTLIPSAVVGAGLVLVVLPLCRIVLGTSLQPPRMREVELV